MNCTLRSEEPEGRKTSAQRGYGYKWQQARKHFLDQPGNQLCVMCSKQGYVTPASVVDHIIPHKGDLKLFWDRKNWQPLCAPCHNRDKQSEERTGKAKVTTGADGWPE